ncbi:MAG: hypothetical protein ABDI19_01600 [Armatimonadota bacterium]
MARRGFRWRWRRIGVMRAGLMLLLMLPFADAGAQPPLPLLTLPKEVTDYLGRETPPANRPPATPEPTRRAERRNTFDAIRNALRSWDAFEQELRTRVTISGRKTMGFHLHQVEGDAASFRDQNYYGQGGQRTTDYTDLSIRVDRLFGLLSFDWRWSNSRFRNPFDTRITWTYESPNFTMEWGDINAVLGGQNQLVAFHRTLKGAIATAKFGRSSLRYITSETKAAARTITIQGNDSPGPYYLQGSQIVDGSERVQVDGVEKRRGEDYTIDYYAGILQFREGMIIPRTSTIVVTYETYAFNSRPSRLDGWRFETQLGRGINLGVSMLSQKVRGGLGLRPRTEQFYGRGAPSVPYDLDFPPLRDSAHPIVVLVAGAPQREGEDYYFDPVLPYRFYFTRFIPQTLIVQVTYTPLPDPGSTIGGNREVIGADITFPLGKIGNIVWNVARSRAQTLGASLEGIAHIAEAKLNFGRMNLNTVYHRIPAEFISIESVGFRRNETGHRSNLSYQLGRATQFQLNWSQSRVASLNPLSGGFSTSFTDTDIRTYTLSHTPANGFSINLTRTQNRATSTSSHNQQTIDALSIGRTWKNLTLTLGYDRTDAVSRFRGSGGSPTEQTYRIQSLRARVDWTVNERLTIQGTAATSDIRQTNSATRARDFSLSASWRPTDRLEMSYRWSDLDSGTLGRDFFGRTRQGGFQPPLGGGFQNPWGVGYNGNGFSSGAPSFSGYTYYGVRGKGHELNLRWTPFDTVSVDVQASIQRAAGDFQTNSEQRALSVGVSYLPFEWLALNATWSKQDVEFLTASGSSKNEYLALSAEIGPLNRWTFNINFYQMTTQSVLGEGFSGTPGAFTQQPVGLAFRASYAIAQNQSLFAEWQRTDLRGYLASRDTLFNFGYEYRITRNLSFVLSYRFREQLNLDPQYRQYSYRARSLDANLNFQF